MFRLMSVLLVLLLCGGNAYGTGFLTKLQSGAAQKAGKVMVLGGAIFGLSCGMMACDDMKPNQIVDAIGDGDGGDDTPPTTGAVIKIGMNYLGDRDPNSLDGAELAVAQINAAGGVNVGGTYMQIELLSFDNEKNITRSVDMTNAFIKQGVVGLIGPEYSSHGAATGPVATAAKIPMITTTATNPKVAESGDYVFMGAFTDSFQGLLMAKFAIQDLGADTAAILTKEDDPYSVGLSEKFRDSFSLLGGQIVAHESYPIGSTNFATQLNVIAAKNPHVLFIPGHVPDAPLAAKEAREMGIEATLLGGDGWGGAGLIEDGGDALEGAYFSDHFYTIPTAGLSEDTLQFIADFVEMHGVRPISRSALGFDTVHLLAQAIEQAGSLDGTDIRDALAVTMHYSGATYIDSFSEEGFANKNIIIKTVKDGGIVFFKLVNP